METLCPHMSLYTTQIAIWFPPFYFYLKQITGISTGKGYVLYLQEWQKATSQFRILTSSNRLFGSLIWFPFFSSVENSIAAFTYSNSVSGYTLPIRTQTLLQLLYVGDSYTFSISKYLWQARSPPHRYKPYLHHVVFKYLTHKYHHIHNCAQALFCFVFRHTFTTVGGNRLCVVYHCPVALFLTDFSWCISFMYFPPFLNIYFRFF